MKDMIYRSDAIEAVRLETAMRGLLGRGDILDILSALPSAEAVTHGRLIDADALNEKLCETTIFIKDGEVFQRMINDAPTVSAVQGWIPCSERLPSEDGDAYIVTDYCPLINRRRTRIAYCYANKDGFWSDTPKGYEVLAWMPLPKPYREDGEA